MNDLLGKLSSYNTFNYLLPGIVFVIAADAFTQYSFVQRNLVVGAFIYYFIGMIISRFGSLVVEPILKRVSFVDFADYRDFVIASKKDPKIELLSETNNTYRSLFSALLLLGLLVVWERIEALVPALKHWTGLLLLVALLLMFLFSYKKQSAYVTKRVEANAVKE